MGRMVVGVFYEDDTVHWCYCYDTPKRIARFLAKNFNEHNAAKVIARSDIEKIYGDHYSRIDPITQHPPFRSKKSMMTNLDDDVSIYFLYDACDGWVVTTRKRVVSLEKYLRSKDSDEEE